MSQRHRYLVANVFAESRFGGNPLAVFPDASGIEPARLQRIAAELNLSETTFVLPPERGGDFRMRIFTPRREMPFAGHPNVGTAFVLAHLGVAGDLSTPRVLRFEQPAGIVPVQLARRDDGRVFAELTAPQPLVLDGRAEVRDVAKALGLSSADVLDTKRPPRIASVGFPFLMVELASRAALARARPIIEAFEWLKKSIGAEMIHAYASGGDGFDLHARMFAPLESIAEDPATGSANAALAGMLVALDPTPDRDGLFRISQGVDMGRPSVLEARVTKRDGRITAVAIGGTSVLVADGELWL